jgi:hypothetical protein
MRKKFSFTVTKKMEIMLPIPLVCKTTGYVDKYMGHGTWGNGEQFCEIGKTYMLTDARMTDDNEVEFIMQTESYNDSGTCYLCDHRMDYEFMAKYFFVSF